MDCRNPILAGFLVATAAGAVCALAACGEGCPLVDCSSGVTITLEGDLSWWPAAGDLAVVTASIDGLEVDGVCPDAPGAVLGYPFTLRCSRDEAGRATIRIADSGSGLLARPGGALDGQLTFDLQAGERVLPFRTGDARPYRPGGDGCEPTCYGRSATIAVR